MIGTFPPYRGGIAHFNSALYRTLSENHIVTAYNFIVQYPSIIFPGKTQFEEGSPIHEIPSNRVLNSVNPLSWIKTGRKIGKQKPDLILFKYWMPFFAPAFGMVSRWIKRISPSTKILVILDNVIPHESKFWDIPATKYFFNVVDGYVAMSNSVKSDLLFLYPQAKVTTLAHPVYDIFGSSMDRTTAKRILGYNSTEKVILYFGFIRKYKGVDWLIRAADIIKNELSDFKIIIVGESYIDTKPYTDLIKEFGLQDIVDLKIDFIPDSDVSTYFCASDLVVLPYKSATQSGIAQIAYHFNRSMVVTDVGGLAEIVPHGKAGLVVKPEVSEIANGIISYFQNYDQQEMETFVESYKENFSWEYFCDGLIRFSCENRGNTDG